MRKSILLSAVLTSAACNGEESGYVVLDDLIERSSPARCEVVDLGDVALDLLRSASDTSFVVLDGARRRVTEFDDRLRPTRSFEYLEYGPGKVDRPEDLAVVSDTAVAIAARGGLKLVVLDWAGKLIHTQPLQFIPHALTATPEGDVLITAIPVGSSPTMLFYRYRDGVLDPYPVRGRTYGDMTVGALGNYLIPLSLGGGEALTVHQFFEPRAFHVNLVTGDVTQLPMPTADGTAGKIHFVPTPPIRTEHVGQTLVPALDGAVDRRADAVYILTKSGRTAGDAEERVLLRLGERLGYRASWTLDVPVRQMAILPRRDAVLVADNADGIHLCLLNGEADAE